MQQDCDGGAEAHLVADQIRRPDRQAVGKVVREVCDKVEVPCHLIIGVEVSVSWSVNGRSVPYSSKLVA